MCSYRQQSPTILFETTNDSRHAGTGNARSEGGCVWVGGPEREGVNVFDHVWCEKRMKCTSMSLTGLLSSVLLVETCPNEMTGYEKASAATPTTSPSVSMPRTRQDIGSG